MAPLRAGKPASVSGVAGRRAAYKAGRAPIAPYSRPMAGPRRTYTSIRAIRNAANEKKGMDTDVSLSPIISTTNSNASMFTLNLIQTGTGSWNRIGRKAHLKSLRITGTVSIRFLPTVATGASTNSMVRMVVVWDKQPSGNAVPLFDAIFGITDQSGAESCPDIMCPPRYDNMDRFKVIRDCRYTFNSDFQGSGTAPNMDQIISVDEYVKLGGRECVYSGQSAPMTIADISTGALYIYFRSTADVATSRTSMDGICRLRFTD